MRRRAGSARHPSWVVVAGKGMEGATVAKPPWKKAGKRRQTGWQRSGSTSRWNLSMLCVGLIVLFYLGWASLLPDLSHYLVVEGKLVEVSMCRK